MLEGRVAASQRLAKRLVDAGHVGMLVRRFAADASEDDGYRLFVRPVMGLVWMQDREAKQQLTPVEAAEHLWRMFMQPMQ